MYDWSRNISQQKFHSLSSQLLSQILKLSIKINHYNFDLLIQYMKEPVKEYREINTKQSKIQKNYTRNEGQWSSFTYGESMEQDEMIKDYLTQYMKVNEKISPFDEFMNQNYLEQLLIEVQLYQGKIIPNITEKISSSKIKELENQKLISICKFNKSYFKGDDEVKIHVELKNIPYLTIKIFEIQVYNYYKQNKQTIDNSLNLDGLIASKEELFTFKEAPIIKQIKEFHFESISKVKQGIFIIEFIGNGVQSKAIIQKGILTAVEQTTLSGHKFLILDENSQICKGQNTGIWFESRFFNCNPDTGVVSIPFTSSRKNDKAILVHNDFAVLQEITIEQEAYQFYCSYLYNKENFIMGTKAKILIQTKLFVNEIPCSLEIVKNQQVIITTTNDMSVPTTVTFNDVKFSHEKDLEIQFFLPPKTISIDIQVKGSIKTMTKNSIENVSSSNSIKINNYDTSNIFCEQFLKYTKSDGYELYILGKNGEPKKDVVINLSLTCKSSTAKFTFIVQTNQHGFVSLGHLSEDIVAIESATRIRRDITTKKKIWYINQSNDFSYPSKILICEGDKVEIPYPESILNQHALSFYKVKISDEVLANNLVQLKKNGNYIEIENLAEGLYTLNIKKYSAVIKIQVIKGKYLSAQKGIIDTGKTMIQQIDYKKNILFINDIKINENQENPDKSSITFSVDTYDPKTTRLHVLAYQFYDESTPYYINELEKNIKPQKITEIPIQIQANQYYSNKSLSDEYNYVLERKKQNRFIGNTLERPQLLLMKTKVQETSYDTEIVKDGTDFKESQVNQSMAKKKKLAEGFYSRESATSGKRAEN